MDKRAEALEQSVGTNYHTLYERVDNLAQERTEHLATIAKLEARSWRMEGICRALQTERTKLQSQVTGLKEELVEVSKTCPFPPPPFSIDAKGEVVITVADAVAAREAAFREYETALQREHCARHHTPADRDIPERKLTPEEHADLLAYEKRIQEAVLKDIVHR
jgi:hypothetical protein